MAENLVSFSARPTPTHDDFETVSLWFGISQSTGGGAITGHKILSTTEARELAADLIKASEIVEKEQEACR